MFFLDYDIANITWNDMYQYREISLLIIRYFMFLFTIYSLAPTTLFHPVIHNFSILSFYEGICL